MIGDTRLATLGHRHSAVVFYAEFRVGVFALPRKQEAADT